MNKAQLIFLIALLVFSSSCLANKQLKVFFDKESGIQISANCYGVTIKEGVREDSLNFVMFRDFTQRYLCHRCCNEKKPSPRIIGFIYENNIRCFHIGGIGRKADLYYSVWLQLQESRWRYIYESPTGHCNNETLSDIYNM